MIRMEETSEEIEEDHGVAVDALPKARDLVVEHGSCLAQFERVEQTVVDAQQGTAAHCQADSHVLVLVSLHEHVAFAASVLHVVVRDSEYVQSQIANAGNGSIELDFHSGWIAEDADSLDRELLLVRDESQDEGYNI